MTVEQPGNVRFSNDAKLIWDPGFAQKWNGKFVRVQVALGKKALGFCEPYIPLQTGRLIASGSVDEEGNISWSTPYARKQYYTPREVRTATGSLRGPFWFQRMKEARKQELVAEAQEAL
jgi:hypothetical protein